MVKNMNFLILVFGMLLVCCSFGNAKECKPSATPPDPKSGCCGGVVLDKIIPGFNAQLTEYPWMGLIEYQKDNKTKLLCSAVLISGRYMLSAAQCFGDHAKKVGTPINVRLGEYDTSNDGPDCLETGDFMDCNDGATTIAIEKVITHPGFDSRSRQDDIALIRLAKMAPLTEFIQPICLPSSDVTLKPAGLRLRAAGWGIFDSSRVTYGHNNLLHHVSLPYMDNDTCNAALSRKSQDIKIGNGQLCAGGEGKDSCRGDSGGPLMYYRDFTSEVAGIVSFGAYPCGQIGVPSVYTKVFAYDAWIRTNIEE